MKKILFLTGVVSLLTLSGCLVSDGGGGGRGYYHEHTRYYERPAVVVVRPAVVVEPVVRVRVN